MASRSAWGDDDDQRFNLVGPRLKVEVTRTGKTLPIAEVPDLLAGDQLEITPDLPATQANHLLLMVAFLRSATNEPPNDWFTRIETWKPAGRKAQHLTVPEGAQRVLAFIAPETGGDFDTLRSTVKHNPGLFLRASATLFKASLEQQRIERYLAGMQSVAQKENSVIAARSAKLASALSLKPDEDCFKQPVEDQVDCLTKTSAPLLLDSGTDQSISAAISTGASSDFINEASQTDGGIYSAYIGTLVDLVHLIGLLHTAQYQYIPALTLPDGATVSTRLNAPPSFGTPKSVIVVALPPVRQSRIPSFRLASVASTFCLRNPATELPLRGATVLYSAAFAHDLYLDFGPSAHPRQIPLTPDTAAGAFLLGGGGSLSFDQISSEAATTAELPNTSKAVVRGFWGFEAFEGPSLVFQETEGVRWKLSDADNFVAGQKAIAQLQSSATACLRSISIAQGETAAEPVSFTTNPDGTSVQLTLRFEEKQPGTYSLHLLQYGAATAAAVSLKLYPDQAAKIDKAYISPDHTTVSLSGSSLDAVKAVQMGSQMFTLAPGQNTNATGMFQGIWSSTGERPKEAVVILKDGRTLSVPILSEDPSLVLRLLSSQATIDRVAGELPVELRSPAAIPLHSMLHFVLAAEGKLSPDERVELSAGDEATSVMLSFYDQNGSLILEDSHTAVATLDLDHAFGESAFGVLRLRAIKDRSKGEWISLGTLVRRPHITQAQCAADVCKLHGRELYLLESVSATDDFQNAAIVPVTATSEVFAFPVSHRPVHSIYLRLRDAPGVPAVVQLSR